ncbi:MAG: hypothetical protein EOP44_07410 [Sphingobacteriaceae bacterium]|nr:MAG: hypothetical protein EOP44_07410 [Sphingobacteriaceae bacterium]
MSTEINKDNTPDDEPPLFPDWTKDLPGEYVDFTDIVGGGRRLGPQEMEKAEAQALKEINKSKAGRKPKPDKETGVLQVRGVDQETKNIFDKAVKRTGKTAGQFFNTEIREFLQGIVKKSAQPPATGRKALSHELLMQYADNLSFFLST